MPTMYKPRSFFRNVSIPDDRQLDIEEICPEQAKGKKQFADVMKVSGMYV